MTKLSALRISGIRFIIERANRESNPFMFLREVVQNALEAGASNIRVTHDKGKIFGGPRKMIIQDDGIGMNPHEMIEFMGVFGAGSKNIGGPEDNFGIGAKTTMLPWNHAGLIIASWTHDNPKGSQITLGFSGGEYGILKKYVEEEGGVSEIEPVNPNIPRMGSGAGTTIVCVGNTPKEETYLGPENLVINQRGVHFLNKRYWDFGENFSNLSVISNKGKSIGVRSKEDYISIARVKGLKKILEERANLKGVVDLRTAKAYWFVLETYAPQIENPGNVRGNFCAVLYDNELYNLRSDATLWTRLGIFSPSLKSNLFVIFEPKKKYTSKSSEGVYPISSRDSLKYWKNNSSQELPYMEWVDDFRLNMPPSLKELMSSEETGDMDTKWRDRVLQYLGRILETSSFLKDLSGYVSTRNSGHTRGSSKNGGSKTGGGSRKKKNTLPQVEWRSEEAIGQPIGGTFLPEGDGLFLLNQDWPPVITTINYWSERFPEIGEQEIRKIVFSAIAERLVTMAKHMESLWYHDGWGKQTVSRRLFSDDVITALMFEVKGLDAMLTRRMTLFGKHTKK